MEKLKVIEKFWSKIVTAEGLAPFLEPVFNNVENDEVKAFAMLSRATFLMTMAIKNDRDDSLRQKKFLINEIKEIQQNCSAEFCHNCPKIKRALNCILEKYENLSEPCKVSTEKLMQTDKQNGLLNHNKSPFKILAVDTEIMPHCSADDLLKDNALIIPETLAFPNSQYGSDNVFDESSTKEFVNVLKQRNGDIDACFSVKKCGAAENVIVSPILGKKQVTQQKPCNNASCVSNCELGVSIESSVGSVTLSKNKLEKYTGQSSNKNQSHLNFGTSLRSFIPSQNSVRNSTPESTANSPSMLGSCRILSSPQLHIQNEFCRSTKDIIMVNKTTAKEIIAIDQVETGAKRSLNFPKSPGPDASAHPESPGPSSSSSIKILSTSNNAELTDLLSNAKMTPERKKTASLQRHKSEFSVLSSIKAQKTTPLARTATSLSRSSKIKIETSFIPNTQNGMPKKTYRQTTLTQDCFIKKNVNARNTKGGFVSNFEKKLRLKEEDDRLLDAAIKESFKSKQVQDMIRTKKEELLQGKKAAVANEVALSPIECEEDLFIYSPEKVTNKVLQKDKSLLQGSKKSPSTLSLQEHPTAIKKPSENLKKKKDFGIKQSTSRVTPQESMHLQEESRDLKFVCKEIGVLKKKEHLSEEEILAQLSNDSQILDHDSTPSTPKKKKKKREPKQFEDSFDIIPPRADEPGFAHKGPVIRKKSEKQKVDGWECHECKDYFHSKGLSEEQKKLILNKCSRHRSKYKQVTNTPQGFWNPDWDSIIEPNGTQFETPLPPRKELKHHKKRSKSHFTEFESPSTEDLCNTEEAIPDKRKNEEEIKSKHKKKERQKRKYELDSFVAESKKSKKGKHEKHDSEDIQLKYLNEGWINPKNSKS